MNKEILAGRKALELGCKAFEAKEYLTAIKLFKLTLSRYTNQEEQSIPAKDIATVEDKLFNAYIEYGLQSDGTISTASSLYINGENVFESAVKLRPDSPVGHYHLGDAYLRQGRLSEAIAEYKKSIELFPKEGSDIQLIKTYYGIITAYEKRGSTNELHNVLKEAYQFISKVEITTLSSSSIIDKVNSLLEQYAKLCISTNTQDSPEIDTIEALYQQINSGKTLGSAIVESTSDKKVLVSLTKYDKVPGVFENAQEKIIKLLMSNPIGNDMVIDSVLIAQSPEDLELVVLGHANSLASAA